MSVGKQNVKSAFTEKRKEQKNPKKPNNYQMFVKEQLLFSLQNILKFFIHIFSAQHPITDEYSKQNKYFEDVKIFCMLCHKKWANKGIKMPFMRHVLLCVLVSIFILALK